MRLYSFNKVIGNHNVVAMIRQSIQNNNFPQISIFSGVYGTGKSTCAEITGLALTCDNSTDGEPCLGCPKCLNTIESLQKTGSNERVIKINVGQKNTKADIDTMIRDIFILKGSDNTVVYIIEEAHALSEAQQTALLEELDKIPNGVYVIFCTTKLTKLLPELRSRAINFAFTRITDSEADTLLDQLGTSNKFPLSKETKKIVINHGRGIPRQLTNLFEFIKNGNYKTETLAAFLGIISEGDFIDFFKAVKSDDMFIYTNTLDQLIKAHSLDTLIEQLKEFSMKVMFLIEGNIKEGLTENEAVEIREIFRNVNLTKVINQISSINNNVSVMDFKFAMLRIRQLMLNKEISSIISDSAIQAVMQNNKVAKLNSEATVLKQTNANSNSLTQLNVAFMNQFGGDA